MDDLTRQPIETERLLLRQIREDDTQAVFDNWASDPEVSRYLTWPAHRTIEDTKAVMQRWMKDYEDPKTCRFGIVIKESGELIGSIDIVDFVDGAPEIGYCMSRKHWNKAYMTEACRAFMRRLFDLGYKRIVIEADQRNIGSNRVIEKCGFIFTHTQTKPCSSFKPDIITVNWYSKTKE